MIDLIKKLTQAYGPSSHEEEVKAIIKEELKGKNFEVKEDALGNLIFRAGNSQKEKMMVAAHMDQIGIIVTDVDKNGFIRFSSVGGLIPHMVVGQKFIFKNGTKGVVHFENKEGYFTLKEPALEKFYLDIGATSKQEAESLVSIGDMAIYYSPFVEREKRLTSKAMDDRIGCAVLVQTLNELDVSKLKYDVYAVFSVQEEIGLKGAKTAAYQINPQYGIALDVTGSGDTPESYPMALSLGKGPAIKVKDSYMIASKEMVDLMKKTAEKNSIPYQLEVLTLGSTDAAQIQVDREGVIAGTISIPTRYIHTPNETLDLNDVLNSVKLLKGILEGE